MGGGHLLQTEIRLKSSCRCALLTPSVSVLFPSQAEVSQMEWCSGKNLFSYHADISQEIKSFFLILVPSCAFIKEAAGILSPRMCFPVCFKCHCCSRHGGPVSHLSTDIVNKLFIMKPNGEKRSPSKQLLFSRLFFSL